MARWRVAMTGVADRDFIDIVQYSIETFGSRQARIYQSTLKRALKALEAGPELRGSSSLAEIAPGLRGLHVARSGRRGRHVIVYRPGPAQTIEVLRILHDAMDLPRQLPRKT